MRAEPWRIRIFYGFQYITLSKKSKYSFCFFMF